jgi:hypothetical protein
VRTAEPIPRNNQLATPSGREPERVSARSRTTKRLDRCATPGANEFRLPVKLRGHRLVERFARAVHTADPTINLNASREASAPGVNWRPLQLRELTLPHLTGDLLRQLHPERAVEVGLGFSGTDGTHRLEVWIVLEHH